MKHITPRKGKNESLFLKSDQVFPLASPSGYQSEIKWLPTMYS